MKRSLALFLALVMVFALCACGSQQTTTTQQTTAPVQAAASEAITDSSSALGQANLIYQNLATLKSDEPGRAFWYTVTDLDHNGRLELIAAITEGANSYTTVNINEVSSDYKTLNPVSLGLNAGDSMPEIIVKSAEVLSDANGYHYIYTDTNSDALNGTGHYFTKGTITLTNGTLTHKVIAYQDISYMNGYTIYTTYDGDGVEQDPATFTVEGETEELYPNATKSTVNFDWFSLSEATSPARLYTSYCVFAGTADAPVQPASTATPAPTSTIKIVDVTNPVLKKSPTSESITAGGSCTFVAQAIGYNYMRWQLVSPYGNVYDASSSNPYPANLSIYGATSQSLTLAGVPADMNGWKVQAVFTGDTESVTSDPATIYVSSSPTPSYVTISFSEGWGTTFYNTINYVYVYSSNGADIRVEATKGGDTGCYYSQTIPSGSAFPVQGIAGQNVSVNVVATCGDSQANVTYYVDNEPYYPTPEPTYWPVPTYIPDPTPQPSTQKTGYVDSVNTYGGCYYVGITFEDGTTGRYDITNMVSNPPSVGQRVGCSFAADGITLTDFWFE